MLITFACALGCGDDDVAGIDAGSDAGIDAGIDADTGSDASPPVDAAGDARDTDAGFVNACKHESGICLASVAACSAGEGTHASAGDEGCVFDDGAGICCVPPSAASSGDTCRAHGGLCAPVSGCNFVRGGFAPPSDCVGVPNVCCVLESVCGPETVVCCDAGPAADFRPQCDRGTFRCDAFPGTVLIPIVDCD